MITDERIELFYKAEMDVMRSNQATYSIPCGIMKGILGKFIEAYEQSKWCDDMSKAPKELGAEIYIYDGFHEILVTYETNTLGGYGYYDNRGTPYDGLMWRHCQLLTPPKE